MTLKIDSHGHVSAPPQLYVYKATLLSHRGAHGKGKVQVSDEQVAEALRAPNPSFGNISHLDHLDQAGIDTQLISPRPFQMMHSETPAKLVQWFTEHTNDMIARVCASEPSRFVGVAGLPQSMELSPKVWADELERSVRDLGFVAGILNPDPYEGTAEPPALSDPFWYPLYEKFCELDVPAYIHSAGCRPPARESYSLHFIQEETQAVIALLESDVFDHFPDLKVVVSHGGGAIPYQRGRFTAGGIRRGRSETFEERLRKLWYDTALYTKDAIEFLIKAVGVDRCLFATEKPGTGSVKNPETGGWVDDVGPLIDDISWLTDEDRRALYYENTQKLFKLDMNSKEE